MKLTAKQKGDTKRWTRSKADEMAVANGCWFDLLAANDVVDFFKAFLRHSKGEWANEPFTLLKWQAQDVIKPLFGWKRSDGTRRFRTAYIEIPKKNGKSTLCSGLALYMLLADGEPGAEIYSAAATRDQAAIVYKEATSMRKASPSLNSRLKSTDSLKHMADERTNSWYKALAADADTAEGLNIHCLLMDEMHAQKTDKFWNTLMYGGAARRQPLQVIITTAGVDQQSICYEYHTKAMQIQSGTIQDDAFLGYVRSAEWAMLRAPEEDRELCWHDEKVWHEANPSLGDTISLESFREDYQRAVQSPRLENAFKRYRLNIWTQQDERWLPLDHWAACGADYDEESLRGKPCYAGLDLASTSDLCALVLYFPTADKRIQAHFWVPQETVDELERKGKPEYAMWKKQGFLHTTPGNSADYDYIREEIIRLGKLYDFKGIAFDRWGATQISQQLQGGGFRMVNFGQGYASMSAPSKDLERMILGHEISHPRHPVLTWCIGNAAKEEDAAGNIKPSKAKSQQKIDGAVALIMAIGAANLEPPSSESVYNTRGLTIL